MYSKYGFKELLKKDPIWIRIQNSENKHYRIYIIFATPCSIIFEVIQSLALSGLMMSLHMKATMMKISDPIIFGHCVKVYFKASFPICYILFVACLKSKQYSTGTCIYYAFM